MKALITLALLAASSAVSSANIPVEYEVEPGCIWSATSGRCVIQNSLHVAVKCDVDVTVKTERGITIGFQKKAIVIQPRMFDDSIRAFAPEGDSIRTLSATAKCFVM